ncbi:MAG: hypothetical protein ABI726_06565 [bacterium]
MALSPDQRAMLELLLGRAQTYSDLASLLDVPEAEVRARARAALTVLAGADPDRNVGLTDYLLGQADPIGRADAARHLKEDPADHRLASGLAASLQMIVPSAQLPKLPAEPGGEGFLRRGASEPAPPPPAAEAAAAPSQPGAPRESSGSGRSSSQNRLMIALGAGGVILIAIVLAITGAFGGGEDGDSSATATTTAATSDDEVQEIPLNAAKGSDATGSATFGIANGSQLYVDLDIAKLEPAPQDKAYVFWLLASDARGYPLQPFEVNQDGTFSERVPIDSFLTELVGNTRIVDVSLSEQRPLLNEVNDAVSAGQSSPIIAYTGESILRGAVPQGGAAAGAG